MIVVSEKSFQHLIEAFLAAHTDVWTTRGLRICRPEPIDEQAKRARALLLGALTAMNDGDGVIEQGVFYLEDFGAPGKESFMFPRVNTKDFK